MRHFPAIAGITIAALSSAPNIANAITIQFDFTYDTSSFFSFGSDARDRLEDAGTFFSDIIADDFDAIVPGGGNSWNAQFSNPSSPGPPTSVSNPTIPADTIVIYVGARNLGVSGSGDDILGQAGPGFWNGFGDAAWFDLLFQRGEVGSTQSPGATDFALWGGSLSMDSDSLWDYGFDDSTLDPGENHFYSVLLHEIGHVLGVGIADSWDEQVVAGEFTGAASFAEYGDNVPLTADNGHWTADTDPGMPGDQPIISTVVGTGEPQEPALDPNITVGTRKVWTDLDNAALTDIGWEIVAAVPEPSSGLLALFGLLGLASRRRR